MSKGPSTFDPRYDVRFQRGYIPSATPVPPAAKAEVTNAADAGSREHPTGPPVPPPAAEPAVGPAPTPLPREGGRGDAVERPADVPLPAAEHETARAAEPASRIRATTSRWLWLVLGAGVLFVVVGSATYWSVVSRQNPFESGVGARDVVFEQMLTSLAPAVVQAGVLGIVGALLAWALLGGRSSRTHDGRP